MTILQCLQMISFADKDMNDNFILMRQLQLKTFGIAREILGAREVSLKSNAETVGMLRTELIHTYPSLGGLGSIMIAVNRQYAQDDNAISPDDEIAILPPVSGG